MWTYQKHRKGSEKSLNITSDFHTGAVLLDRSMKTTGGGEDSGRGAVAVVQLGTVQLTITAELQIGRRHPSDGELSLFARTLYQERRLRDRLFSLTSFGEPTWDILLDLFASEAEGKRVSIGSACLAAAVPATTGLRYIRRMEQEGLIRRSAGADRRVAHLYLTDTARQKLEVVLTRLLEEFAAAEPTVS